MVLFVIFMIILLIILLVLLYLRILEDRRVKINRREIPGKVSVIVVITASNQTLLFQNEIVCGDLFFLQ